MTRKNRQKKIRLAVLGLRGFPDVPGGVETHAENLYPLISDLGFEVTCISRSPYHDLQKWQDIKFVRLWAPRSKFLEALVHSVVAVIWAAFARPDVLHIHAVGPSLVVPLARLFGLRVVVTHHGPDYDREKWNRLARRILLFGEWCGMRFANQRIVISQVIADIVRNRYGVDSTIIPNGVRLPVLDADAGLLRKFSLEPGRYALLVSRFVPEKRHLDLIDAYERAAIGNFKLALVGDSDHPDSYDRALKERAASNPGVVLTGYLGGDELRAVFEHAGVFVLPSSHEGLPISLLEALSFGLPCLASGIPANRSVGMADDTYFELGDVEQLAGKLVSVAGRDWTDADRDAVRQWVGEHYDWRKIAAQTADVYRKAVG